MQHSISTFFFLLFSKKKLVTCVTHPDLLRISTVHINAFCFTVRSYCKILESIEINGTLCKIPKFDLNFPGVETLWKHTVSAEFRANCPKQCGNCAFPQNLCTRKLAEISVFSAVFVPISLFTLIFSNIIAKHGYHWSIGKYKIKVL